jgi:hypothetical protein
MPFSSPQTAESANPPACSMPGSTVCECRKGHVSAVGPVPQANPQYLRDLDEIREDGCFFDAMASAVRRRTHGR